MFDIIALPLAGFARFRDFLVRKNSYPALSTENVQENPTCRTWYSTEARHLPTMATPPWYRGRESNESSIHLPPLQPML